MTDRTYEELMDQHSDKCLELVLLPEEEQLPDSSASAEHPDDWPDDNEFEKQKQ